MRGAGNRDGKAIVSCDTSRMSEEQLEVLQVFRQMQQPMVDGDATALGAAIENGTVMVHMSGRGQSKEDFIREATNGTLNYFHSDIREAHIEVSGDRATLEGTVDLTARVYGMSGTWPVPTHASFHRVSSHWLFSNPAKHTL